VTDIHQQAADVLGVPRKVAKQVNFGLLYGRGAQVGVSSRGLGSIHDYARGEIKTPLEVFIEGVFAEEIEAGELQPVRKPRLPLEDRLLEHWDAYKRFHGLGADQRGDGGVPEGDREGDAAHLRGLGHPDLPIRLEDSAPALHGGGVE